jgi:hypothetical protein
MYRTVYLSKSVIVKVLGVRERPEVPYDGKLCEEADLYLPRLWLQASSSRAWGHSHVGPKLSCFQLCDNAVYNCSFKLTSSNFFLCVQISKDFQSLIIREYAVVKNRENAWDRFE